MSAPSTTQSAVRRKAGSWRRTVTISAWSIPVMVMGQFSMLAVVPVALVLNGTLRDPDLQPLRPAAAVVAATYAAPLALWAIGPHRAKSLSKDMHPAFVRLISVVASAFAVTLHRSGGRRIKPGRG